MINGKESAISLNTPRRNRILLGGVHVAVPTFLMLAVCIYLAENNAEQRAALGKKTVVEVVVAVTGSLLYTIVGAANLYWLSRDAGLTPLMAYSNSFMCWSALFFGLIQIYTDTVAGFRWPLRFDHWYTLPNFGWAIEWGLHLLGGADSQICGVRAAIIMSISIASISLEYVVPGKMGYVIAILPQVVAAMAMCIYCIHRYYSQLAIKALFIFAIACLAFLLLHKVDSFLPAALTGVAGYEIAKTVVIKLCDNTQIHFSIVCFVEMFRTKRLQQVQLQND